MNLSTSINESSILYELLVYSEWFQENDGHNRKYPLNQQSPSLWSAISYANPVHLWRKSLLTFDIKGVTDLSWKFSVSQDGMLAVILQESLLEIRTAKDGFVTVVGKANVGGDSYPQLRRVAWSPDSTGVAVARDNGSVNLYNLLGSIVTTIPSAVRSEDGRINPVIGLSFLNSKFKTTNWSSELLVVYFDGTIRSYLLSALDSHATEDSIKFSLSPHYPKGLTAAVYHPSHHMLIVAGYHSCGKGQNGITAWRILNDFPYLKLSFSSANCDESRGSWLRFLPSFQKVDPVLINRMRISPDGRSLVCLQSNGSISFWTLPGIQLVKHWPLDEQPEYLAGRTSEDSSAKLYWPVDVDWWSDEAIVLVRRNGAVTVCSTRTMENLLGEAAEVLMGPPQVMAVRGEREGAIILDCEVSVNYRHRSFSGPDALENVEQETEDDEASLLQASIQAALYSVTDIESFQPKKRVPKLVHKTYRLLGLKTVTPEELYARKIDSGAYSDALTLAQTYNLDSDLVYQRQWRINPVSSETITNYLGKVKKVVWVANECVERVPDFPDTAAELLHFGLGITSTPVSDNTTSFEDLSFDDQKLISFRLQILSYIDTLILYQKILGSADKYDSSEYDELRKMSSLEAAVKFAREERYDAVNILLTYKSSAVVPHWLPVISNFPETFRPSRYRVLLPTILGGKVVPWETESLRPPDWAELRFLRPSGDEDVSDSVLYKDEPSLKEFASESLTVDLVEKWYKTRAYQIEQLSGLIEHAVALIRLGREKNVPNLDQLYFDLLTLDALIANVGDDSTSLSTLERMSHLEQVKLLVARTNPSTFVSDMKNHFLPFAKRCIEKGCHDKLTLIRSLLLHYCSTSLMTPLQLFRHVKEHSQCELSLPVADQIALALDCLYTCPETNEFELYLAIFECLPERVAGVDYSETEEKLHDQIDILESHFQVCEILEQSECPRSLRFIKENINNEAIAVQLMESVASYARTKTLNFSELLENLFALQEVFTCVRDQTCYEITVLAQMTCECEEIIQSADQYLTCYSKEQGKPIPFDRSMQLVLEASRTHLEKCLSFEDPYLKLAQTCLVLMSEPETEICEELDFIEAIQLMGDFDIKVLPLQVRMMSNKGSLIEKCLSSRPDAYKSCQRLIQLAQAFRLEGDDKGKREGEVLTLVAKYAFEAGDYKFCSEVSSRLIKRNYAPSWAVVQRLGRCAHFLDSSMRSELLAFCIIHCPRDSLEELIDSRIQLRENVFGSLFNETETIAVNSL